MSENKTLLEIQNLKTYFKTENGLLKAVDDVSYDIYSGETLGLVGESGCGKSVTALSILRLIPSPPGEIAGGAIYLKGENLLDYNIKQMRKIRGNRIGMIFQEPMTSLNPVFTIGNQIMESILLHLDKTTDEARELAIKIMGRVGIPDPDVRINDYPHQMSGGMKQRVMIAMSLVCNPELVIADEPTTALDVTIQAQIIDLMKELQESYGMSILLITHDLAIVAEIADRVVVMYASKIQEKANVYDLYKNPLHPYTKGLFQSIPRLDKKLDKLVPIAGTVPNPADFPSGCKFHTRCPYVMDQCKTIEPELLEVEPDHFVRCHLFS